VLNTYLTQAHTNKGLLHDRDKDLASVEHAFRTCKTAHLEVRTIFLRRKERTPAHSLVVMLAYQIIRYLASCWSAFDVTVEEGLQALATLCLVEVVPKNAPVITASLYLGPPSRNYFIAQTSSSQRSFPFLAHACPRRKNSNQNDWLCEFSYL